MTLTLPSDIQRYITDQVSSGRFPTPESVIAAAIAELRSAQSDADLDDATVAAINQAEAQADRGEGTDLDTFRAGMNNRIAGR